MTMLHGPVTVEARPYEREHGHAPRGFGSWAFGVVDPNSEQYLDGAVWVHQSRYGDAKKEAARQARERGVRVLFVLP